MQGMKEQGSRVTQVRDARRQSPVGKPETAIPRLPFLPEAQYVTAASGWK